MRIPRQIKALSIAFVALLIAAGSAVSYANDELDIYANPTQFLTDFKALEIGQQAPEIPVTKWVRGEPMPLFEKGKVYLVEFWASWCGPCRKSIPELNRIKAKYDIEVIGVAAAELEGSEALETFVSEYGERITYPIAYVEDKNVYRQWMTGARVAGLPWVFLVDREGRIAWWGQPFYPAFHRIVPSVVRGKHVPEVLEDRRQQTYNDRLRAWDMQELAWKTYEQGDIFRALDQFDQLTSFDGERYWFEHVARLDILLNQAFEYERALAETDTILGHVLRYNPHGLDAAARVILDSEDPGLDPSFFEMAEKMTRRAVKLTANQDAETLRTRAEVLERLGRNEEALSFAQEALPLATSEERSSIETIIERLEATIAAAAKPSDAESKSQSPGTESPETESSETESSEMGENSR